MAVRHVFLMLLAIPASFCSLYCEFDDNLCAWKSSPDCDLKLVTNKSLDGDTGYLIADRSSCQPSQISLDVLNQEGPFKFRLKYALIGPGPAVLSVEAQYTMSANRELWSTHKIGNSSWDHHNIVTNRGEIDVLQSISIKTYTSDSSAVAIGSISKIEDFPTTTEFNPVPNSSTIDSNVTNNGTQTHVEYILSRITVYVIGASVGLVSVIIITVTIYCIVCD